MIYGYARVSTKHQETDGNSLDAQEKQLKEAGAEIIFRESFTGTTVERPQFSLLQNQLGPGDTLIITKLDRFARSASQGIIMIESLLEKDIKVHVLNMGLMDNTPTGKLIRSILLAFAEFERDMIVERTQEGRKISGHYGGRPKKYAEEEVELALIMLETHTYKETSELTGISVPTLYRAKRNHLENAGGTFLI